MDERPRPKSSQQLKTLDFDPGRFVFQSWQDVLICVWLQEASASDVRRLARLIGPMVRQYPAGISSVQLVAQSAGRPGADARTVFIETMKKHADDLGCIAVVLGGSGFWASAMSSFITGMRVVAPWSFGFRVYRSIEEAAAWLPERHLKKTSVRLDAAQLAAAIRTAQNSAPAV